MIIGDERMLKLLKYDNNGPLKVKSWYMERANNSGKVAEFSKHIM
jgi:hypothetical protein